MGKADVFTGMSLTEKLIWLKKFGSGSREKYEDRTATGNPVIFTTNFAQNAKALSASFSPKQDFNGYGKPWAEGQGKNILPPLEPGSYVDNGLTVTKNADGTVILNGTPTRTISVNNLFYIPAGEYYFSGFNGQYGGGSIDCYMWDMAAGARMKQWDGTTNSVSDYGRSFDNQILSQGDSIQYRFSIRVSSGHTCDNVMMYPMIRRRADADGGYVPYSNICPITGIDSVDVVANSVTHEFDLGRTAYGGSLNVNTGVLTIDKIKIPVSDSSMMPEVSNGWRAGTNANRIGFAIDTALLPKQNDSLDILCNIGYASANANTNNAFEVGACSLYKGNACMYFRFCVPTSVTTVEDAYTYLKDNNCEFTVPLDTPLTYQLTAQQIALLEGENVIATDGDSLNVTYQVKV